MKHESLKLILSALITCTGHTAAHGEIFKTLEIEASSPKEDLRKKIFGAKLSQRACEILAKDPSVETIGSDVTLQNTVRGIIEALRTNNEKTLRDYFNPRSKVKSGHVLASMAGLKKITGPNLSITNYRTVALNSPDGGTAPIECEDTGVLIHPLYGYPLTVGVWLQASGDSEVARVFAELVPDEKSWTIGAWHIQQWTHAGKDFVQWYQLGQEEAQKARKGSAFIAADIASKLLDGGGFLVFPIKTDADQLRDSQMTREAWFQTIKASFPSDNVIYAGTLFAREGAGVLIRFGIPGELSANVIKEHCQSRLKLAQEKEWASQIAGIRCSYNLPREDSKREGVLGGLYVAKSDHAAVPSKEIIK